MVFWGCTFAPKSASNDTSIDGVDPCRYVVGSARGTYPKGSHAPLTGQSRVNIDEAVSVVEADSNYRVLRRFVPRDIYSEPGILPEYNGLYVDTETTGNDVTKDGILELAMQPFKYTAGGLVTSLGRPFTSLNDPQMELTENIRRITGISPEDIVGQAIDQAAMEEMAQEANLIIAHNANFDRRILERPYSIFEQKPWGCSQQDVPWRTEFGAIGERLEIIAMTMCGVFYGAHRALIDCLVGIHVLHTVQDEGGRTALSHLIEAVEKESLRIWAVGAPYHAKDLLKSRGYRWNDGSDGRPKAWHTKVTPEKLDEENEWLRVNAGAYPRVSEISAIDRYSVRER